MRKCRKSIFIILWIMIAASACQKDSESTEKNLTSDPVNAAGGALEAEEISSIYSSEESNGANPEYSEDNSVSEPMESGTICEAEETESRLLSEMMEGEWYYGDDALYLVKLNNIQKIPTGSFSSQVTSEEGENLGTLSFRWYLYEDQVYIDYDWEEDLPIRCSIESIQDCTTAVLLSVADHSGSGYHFLLCDLAQNILVEPFDGRLSEYDFIDTLVLSPDLTEAVFTTGRSTSTYYINGQEIRSLFSEEDQVSGLWLGEDFFISVLDYEENGRTYMDGYLYDAKQDLLLQTVSERPVYRGEELDGNVSGALRMYGCAYGACFDNGVLTFLDLRSGEMISTEVSHSKVRLEDLRYMGNGYFFVVVPDEGIEFLLEAESGNVVAGSS